MMKLMNQRGNQLIIGVFIGALVIVGLVGAYYLGTQSDNCPPNTLETDDGCKYMGLNESTPTASSTVNRTPIPEMSISPKYTTTSTNKTSPSGEFIVSETSMGDRQTITIKDRQGKVIVDNVVNYKSLGYNTKFGCMCATYFRGWMDNSTFVIYIGNGKGEEFEYLVDAATGKVNADSLKRIK